MHTPAYDPDNLAPYLGGFALIIAALILVTAPGVARQIRSAKRTIAEKLPGRPGRTLVRAVTVAAVAVPVAAAGVGVALSIEAHQIQTDHTATVAQWLQHTYGASVDRDYLDRMGTVSDERLTLATLHGTPTKVRVVRGPNNTIALLDEHDAAIRPAS